MSTKLMERTQREAADRTVASYKTLHEDDRTRITHWVIRPGEQTGWHRHEFDYVTVQQSFGRLHLDFADGSTRDIDYQPNTTMALKAPLEHNAINVGDVDIVVLEIEYKV